MNSPTGIEPVFAAYVMGRGHGGELIQENDATAGNTDVMTFLAGVTSEQIWFRHVGNDLEISIIGTADKALVQNWYSGSQYHVEQFKTSDGKTLFDSKVQELVNAMAAFTPPAIGQITLPASYQPPYCRSSGPIGAPDFALLSVLPSLRASHSFEQPRRFQ